MNKKTKQNKSNEEKFKTFSIHETDLCMVKEISKKLFIYKHLENILNIILAKQLTLSEQENLSLEQKEEIKSIFWLLLNPVTMKAVLSNNLGGTATKDSIHTINSYFKDNLLLQQAKDLYSQLNSHNISMLIRRLHKDWSNYFNNLKEYYNGNPQGLTGKPSYPKPKKLSKVYNYSIPLEPSKFSLKKIKQGFLGINLDKKIFYTYIGKNIQYILSKKINNITITYSHGHIYYQFTYIHNNPLPLSNELKINPNNKVIKLAGGDVGINNLLSLFINDHTTKSLIISGKELISYNVNFNKRLAKTNELISNQVAKYKTIIGKNNKEYQVPETYTEEGKILINRREQLFERRKLFLDDYLNKISKKVLTYLEINKVDILVLSKNLSFTKTTGEIKMNKKTKQKFYQIPFGKLLNLIESKSEKYKIEVKWIDEAYTSKTSSLNGDVNEVQRKGKILREKTNKNLPIEESEKIMPNDLSGNRGIKNGPIGRGMFKDTVIGKIINADLNGASNHIKVYLGDKAQDMINQLKQQSNYFFKWCNPFKIKSNHEFDKMIKSFTQIVSRHNLLCEH